MRSRVCLFIAVGVMLFSAANARADYVGVVQADHPFEYFRLQELNAAHTTVAVNSGSTGVNGMYSREAGTGGSFTDVESMIPELTPGKRFNRNDISKGADVVLATRGGAAYGALTAFTFEFLFNPTAYDAAGVVSHIYATKIETAGRVWLNLNGASLQLQIHNAPIVGVDIGTAAPVGEWRHVVVTYEASGAGSLTKFYVNGTLLNPGGTAGDYAYTGNFNTRSEIACWAGQERYIDDALDEFAIYDKVLTQAQISTRCQALGIPEPSTLVLLGCGLIGLLAYAWRRRK